MSRSPLLAALLALPLATALAACGPSGGSDDGDDDGDGGACTAGQTQCVGTQFQTCEGGAFETSENCAAICDPTSGCRTCTPGVNACSGNSVVTCNPDGTFGSTVETCADGTECSGGACQRACSADGVDLIYVADKNYRLLSFDPRLVGHGDPFHVIGPISCAAGPSVPDWSDPGPATPFSMAVDRDAVAWVLYTSGQIFNIDTQTAACSPTSFPTRQNAGGRTWDLFGMGFVTDTAGGDTEKLWLGGGNADAAVAGDLGWINPPSSYSISRVGPMSAVREYSPELTGLGDATLWGFYPGLSTAFVQQIDKNTGGATGPQRAIPGGLGGTVAAWAFAQWGGKFYLFVTTTNGITENSTVRTIDRMTGQYQLVAQNLPYTIVGAGVSTCAPITIGHQLPWETLPQDELPIDGATFAQ
jgi:hypothetical protein